MNIEKINKKVFKYNLAFYYQATIIYFTAFVLYVVIRGEFIENSFTIITKDPIIHFFAIIVLISVVGLVYNIFINRHLEIDDSSISFVDRFKTKKFELIQFSSIRVTNSKNNNKKEVFRFIIVKIKDRKRPLIVRSRDYENSAELLLGFQNLILKLEKN
ncbi:MAG: hypothetical protein CO128_09645 [Ignavibacteriales bacterium CG_4_9_14_3_um_filter_30_11]|nr:MAG: hypothetical protein CO128_09645 [Ignavibacteriales bacterium CG_4_9_14_3_um_filter_30_11]